MFVKSSRRANFAPLYEALKAPVAQLGRAADS
ncbi:uncharacterized protein METZ01_LOCUS276002 [marine metagenome]|uniref:Uncharacterized protein n=1 Tax=marine metagenome TaxID=408172 RepID=A0A382KFH3_9ZZZZ